MNTTNLQTNIVFGNDLQLPKPAGMARFVSLNINGFRRANNVQDALEMAQARKKSSADLCNFQETNVSWRSQCLSQCYKKFTWVYNQARILTSLSVITYHAFYQPRGTMTVVTDDYVGQVIKTGSDTEMGRWSFTRLLGMHGQNIILVSVYQVCNQQSNAVGDRTAFAQQLLLLQRNGKDYSFTNNR
jgi:exonuclease III